MIPFKIQFSSVQSISRVWLYETPWTTACQASLSITNSRSPCKLMSFLLVMPSKHLFLCNHHLQWFWSPPKKSANVSTVSPSISREVVGPDAMILLFWMLSFKPTFSLSLLFHFHQEAVCFLFTFCHKGGITCLSEVIDISPSNNHVKNNLEN